MKTFLKWACASGSLVLMVTFISARLFLGDGRETEGVWTVSYGTPARCIDVTLAADGLDIDRNRQGNSYEFLDEPRAWSCRYEPYRFWQCGMGIEDWRPTGSWEWAGI